MIVISDTSPLSNLFIIQKLDLLQQLYNKVIVPQAVMTELLQLEKQGLDLSPIKNADWIEVIVVSPENEVEKLLTTLDLGEAEAIVLAGKLKADWLLIDEAKGRSVAKIKGLHIVGLLGVLVIAKQQGLIQTVKPLLDDLMNITRFRVSEELYHKVLQSCSE